VDGRSSSRSYLREKHVVDASHEGIGAVQSGVHRAHVGVKPAAPRQLAVHEAEVRAEALLKVAWNLAVA
jgi:hypothetical protein